MDTHTTQRLSASYLAALRTYLMDGGTIGFRLAHEIGSDAVVSGLQILALARIHDAAVETLLPPDPTPEERDQLALLASRFFTEAIFPLEKTHATAELAQAAEQLHQHTQALELSNRQIQQQITTRHHAEAALETSEKSATAEQAESLIVEQQLQEIVRKILCANEEERTKMSQVLQHEIAQALLGIKIKLLALESEATANQLSLTEEINTTHWLVETSAQTLSNLIREFSNHHAVPTH
jgi:signal transduction histidine kinase